MLLQAEDDTPGAKSGDCEMKQQEDCWSMKPASLPVLSIFNGLPDHEPWEDEPNPVDQQ